MDTETFVQSRRIEWTRLDDLVSRASKGLGRLSESDIKEMGYLYRAVTSDLALARRDFPGQRVTLYLNQLVGRAHSVIYRGEPLGLKRIVRFATHGFPQVFRESAIYILAATSMFAIPMLLTWCFTYLDPDTAFWLLPSAVQSAIPAIESRDLWVDIPVQERPYASSAIMQNNIQVTFFAFGGGILAGLGTLYVMVLNGLILGGISGLSFHHGVGWELWEFVIGHGVIELSVIMMAGGSGLMIGWSVIHPGLSRRLDAVAQAAGKAVRLLGGCVPLLVIAGLIEGFISPAELLPWWFKWMVGVGSGAVLYGYLLLAGHDSQSEQLRQDRQSIDVPHSGKVP